MIRPEARAAPAYFEFFAGGGMARAGLGPGWRCLLANDIDAAKAETYRFNWGGEDLIVGDIGDLTAGDVHGRADLAWASFPCQDLSLAGAGAGLSGRRSGAFHAFWRLMQGLADDGRAPPIVAMENVLGALTSHGGADFAAIGRAFADGGYRLGPLVIDAACFTPQSRPRLFMIGLRRDLTPPPDLVTATAAEPFHPPALRRAVERAGLPVLWWRLPEPPRRNVELADILDPDAACVWRTPAQTNRLLALMSPDHLARVRSAQGQGGRRVGTVFRRTRPGPDGGRRQRAEVRFDGLAGCLRTPAGGSSRQLLLTVEGERVRSRWLTGREMARLMGLPEEYRLPARATSACAVMGDGVVASAVRALAADLFEPLLDGLEIAAPPAHMSLTMIDALYSEKILTLAANLPRAGRLGAPQASAEKVSKLCGSRVVADVVMDGEQVADFAQEVKACALGQAAAAVLGASVIGAKVGEIEMARDAFRAMLKHGGAPPQGRFADLVMLEPVKDYPARHASALLAFEATAEACRRAMARTSPADAA
jgi:DNA (cytosine-5)-methyltransferase 1